MSIIKPAKITWQGDNPVSSDMGDVYYSRDDGLQETKYVFLENNQLPQRWTEGDLNKPFTIVETGFGTGLNFLATWEAWKRTELPKRPLHFVSIEKFPLNKEDFQLAHQSWPKLSALKALLIDQYPNLLSGLHLLSFEESKIKLSLIFGDVESDFDKYSFSADCWFLDGFAPSKNPKMWSQQLFDFMAERSKEDTTFATFTSAGFVKRGLQQAGFTVEKVRGYGKKREMLTGYFPSNASYFSKQIPRWCINAQTKFQQYQKNTDFDAIVIGSGLSGLSTAYSLAESGVSVGLIEKNSQLASEATGQTQLAQYAKLPTIDNKEFRFTLQCLLYSQRYFSNLQSKNSNSFWHKTGLIQLAWNDQEIRKQQKIINNHNLPEELVKYISSEEASRLSNIPLSSGGLWYENCGWLDPKAFAQTISEHTSIESIRDNRVRGLSLNEDQSWTVSGSTQTLSAKHVVICTANSAKQLDQLSHLPIKPLRGQVTTINSAELNPSQCILCGEGYLCPPIDNRFHIGATYDLNSNSTEVLESDNQKNLQAIKKWLPGWIAGELIAKSQLTGNAGLRCTTPDYMPIVGHAAVENELIERFPQLRNNANAHKEKYGSYYPNLYVNLGHGSKGLVTTPLCAEYITALILSAPSPLDDVTTSALSPARFLIKDMIQRKR